MRQTGSWKVEQVIPRGRVTRSTPVYRGKQSAEELRIGGVTISIVYKRQTGIGESLLEPSSAGQPEGVTWSQPVNHAWVKVNSHL